MGSDKKKWSVFGIVFVVSVVLDQYTKLLAVNHLKGKRAIDLVENYARLVYAENPGAFLGLGGNWPDSVRFAVFIVLAVVLLVGVLVYLVKKRDVTMWAAIGLSLFASGALGNVIDRVAREGGRVVDFMQLSLSDVVIGGIPMRTGIFNVADIALMAAIPILFFATKDDGDKKSAEENEEAAA